MKELIHFTATWCQPCKAMAPMIDKFVQDNPDIKYVKVDIDSPDADALIQKYEVRGVPTFIINTDNETTARHTGSATLDKFTALFS